ncbi:MAG: family 1 glycosylhydrolase [Thermoprotei archaeon]
MSENHSWDVYPLVFTKDFLFGACVSDYQHFGHTVCDLPPTDGAKHIEHYREDFDLAKSLGFSCFRSGVEWARIEPKQGEYSKDALTFYKEYYSELSSRGLKVFATLHHLTNPPWIHGLGGWLSRQVADGFLKYVETVAVELGDKIDYILLYNEPSIYAYMAYAKGEGGLPPYKKDRSTLLNALELIVTTIAEAADRVRSTGFKGMVGFTHAVPNTKPHSRFSIGARMYSSLAWGPLFYDVLDDLVGSIDFIGLDYYTANYIDGGGRIVASEVDPKGLMDTLLEVWLHYNLPIAVTENGFPTRNHDLKTKYMVDHLVAVAKALEAGVRVFAYNWWSFLHGYEWGYDYKPFFALVDVDKDYKRVPTPTAQEYSKIAQSRLISVEQQEWAHSQVYPGVMRDWRLDASQSVGVRA